MVDWFWSLMCFPVEWFVELTFLVILLSCSASINYKKSISSCTFFLFTLFYKDQTCTCKMKIYQSKNNELVDLTQLKSVLLDPPKPNATQLTVSVHLKWTGWFQTQRVKQTTVLAPVIDLKRGGSIDERQSTDTPPHAGLMVRPTPAPLPPYLPSSPRPLWNVAACCFTRTRFPVLSPPATCWSRLQTSTTPCFPTTTRRWWSATERSASARGSRSARRRSRSGRSKVCSEAERRLSSSQPQIQLRSRELWEKGRNPELCVAGGGKTGTTAEHQAVSLVSPLQRKTPMRTKSMSGSEGNEVRAWCSFGRVSRCSL